MKGRMSGNGLPILGNSSYSLVKKTILYVNNEKDAIFYETIWKKSLKAN